MKKNKEQKHSTTQPVDSISPDMAAARAAALAKAEEDDRIPNQLLVLFKPGPFVCPGAFARYDGLCSVKTLNAEQADGMFFLLQFEGGSAASAAHESLAQQDAVEFVQYNYLPFAGVAYKRAQRRRLKANPTPEGKRGIATTGHRTIIIDGTPMAVSVCGDDVQSINGTTLPVEKDTLRTKAKRAVAGKK